MQLTQYIPSFVDYRDLMETAEVATTEEALALPWLKKLLRPGWRFTRNEDCLFIEREDGSRALVCAHLKQAEALDVPASLCFPPTIEDLGL